MNVISNHTLRQMLIDAGRSDLSDSEVFEVETDVFIKLCSEVRSQHPQLLTDDVTNRAVFRYLTLRSPVIPKPVVLGTIPVAQSTEFNSFSDLITSLMLHHEENLMETRAIRRLVRIGLSGIAALLAGLLLVVSAHAQQNPNISSVVTTCATPVQTIPAAGSRAFVTIDTSGRLCIAGSLSGGGDGAIQDGASSSIEATVFDYTNSNPLAVSIRDANGDIIASFGGGTQYTQGDTDASITGTAMLMEVAADTLQPVQGTVADGLLVNLGSNNDVTITGTATVTATNLDVQIGGSDSLTVGTLPNEGQQTMANSISVAIASDQSTLLVGDGAGAFNIICDSGCSGGAQYTEGDVDATITGTATMMEVAGNTLQPIQGTVADGLLVNLGANNDVDTELVAVAALADNTANPTISGLAAYLMCFDGSTWDRCRSSSAGAGAVDADTTRTVEGSDSPVTVSLQLIDDTIFTDDTSTHTTAVTKLIGIGAVATPTDTAVAANEIGMLSMTLSRELAVSLTTALPAGTNNIGDIDVLSIAAGDNNIGNVDVVTLPALPAGTNNIGDVDILSIAAGDTDIGNVDLEFAGTAASTGVGASGAQTLRVAALIHDGTDTALVSAGGELSVTCGNCSGTGVSHVDEAAFTATSDDVVPIAGVRQDTPNTVADGAAGALRMTTNRELIISDGTGALNVIIDSGTTAVTNAGTFAVQVDGNALTALQLIDNIVGVEDAGETAGGGLAMAGTVRRDAAASSAGTDGDNATLNTDANGRLYVNAAGVTLTVSDGAGALNVICDSGCAGGTQYAIGAVSGATDTVTMAGVIRDDALTTLADADGDVVGLRVTSTGALWSAITNLADDAAEDAAVATDPVPIGGVYRTASVTLDNGDVGYPRIDVDAFLLVNPGTVATWGLVVEDIGETASANLVGMGTVRRDTAASSAGTSGDNATLNTDATGNLWVTGTGTAASAVPTKAVYQAGTDGTNLTPYYVDPCEREARTVYRVDIVTATTVEVAAATASEFYYICSINLVTAAANNVIIVEDDTATNCPSITAGVSSGGTTAAEGWNFGANGGIAAGNGQKWIMKTTTANRSFCIVTSAATQLSGTITYVSAP